MEDIRAAADEFVAALAEQMTAEDLTSENTLYSKIVNLLKIFLQKLGFVNITDSDIKALLHESYKNLAEETQQPPIDNNEPTTTDNNTEEQAAEPAQPTEPNTPEQEQTAPTETEQPTEQEPEAKPKPKRKPAKPKKPKVKPATPTETEQEQTNKQEEKDNSLNGVPDVTSLFDSNAKLRELRDKLLSKKGNGITVFEEREATDGTKGLAIGNRSSTTIYWLDDLTGENGKEELKSYHKFLEDAEKKHDENVMLSKVRSASDFVEYLKSIGEYDAKRGVSGYDIKLYIKQAKDGLANERYIRDVMLPLIEALNAPTETEQPTDNRGGTQRNVENDVDEKEKEDAGFALRTKPETNMRSAISAMRKIAEGADYVPKAVVREDIERYGGDKYVGFYWGETGNPNNNFKGGYGLAHIGAKHGNEVIRQILDVLCNGKIDRYVQGNKTVILSNGKYECVLALTKSGNKETWLLSGWDKIEKADGNSEVSTQSVPTQGSPTFSRTDLGAALSTDKDTTSKPNRGKKGKNDDIRFRISDKRKADIANKVRSKLTDISEAGIDTLITEIEKLGEANKKRGQEGNVRLENAALHFALQGTIRLPEDNEKVIQAFENAERFHDDVTKYKSPEELNAKYAEKIAERERINPDNVKTLSNRQELRDGIVVYNVEDSEQGRRDMRQIINTHFGKDASPWCLLQGDGKGNLTEESGRYWQHYNAFDKRVAFKDGKLLAFFANDVGRPTWWDRNDAPLTVCL